MPLWKHMMKTKNRYLLTVSDMGQWELFLNHIIDGHINAGLRVTEISLPYQMYDMVRKEFNDKINPPDDHVYSIFSYKDCYIARSMGLKTTSIIYERIKEEDTDR